jgi:hypothetical protein
VAELTLRFESETAAASDRAVLADLCSSEGDTCMVVVRAGEAEAVLMIDLPRTARLEAADRLIVRLESVVLADDDAAMAPGAMLPAFAPHGPQTATATVTAGVANNALTVRVDPALAFEGNEVMVTISRNSVIGTATGRWRLGLSSNASAEELASQTDIAPALGDFELAPGEVETTVTLLVRADGLAEDAESFTFVVTEAMVLGDTMVLREPRASLLVAESDNARGIISFDVSAVEAASNVTEVTGRLELRLRRDAGTVGSVSVLVAVDVALLAQAHVVNSPVPAASPDAEVAYFEVRFGDGDNTAVLALDLIDDDIPEPASTYALTLVNVSVPTSGIDVLEPPMLASEPGALLTLTLGIAASDDAFGRLSFASALPMTVAEGSGTVLLQVLRAAGLFGDVSVGWRITPANGIIPSPPGRRDSATEPLDFTTADGVYSGTLLFAAGQDRAELEIFLIDDDVPEGDETLTVTLQGPTGGARLGGTAQTRATVTIAANDLPQGVIAMRTSALSASEEDGVLRVPVVRSGGYFSSVSVQWSIEALSEGLDSDDIVAFSGTLTFEGTSTTADIIITHLDDDIPELEETYNVVLSSPGPGAALGSLIRTRVSLAASDQPHGALGFDCSSRFGGGNIDGHVGGSVDLRVERSGGAFGEVSVQVVTTSDGTAPAGAYDPIVATLTFAEGERSATVTLRAAPLGGLPGGLTVVVSLTAPQGGAELQEGASRATITLYRTESVRQVLDAAAGAACDPKSGFIPPNVIASGSGLTQSGLDAIIQAIQSLLFLVTDEVAGAEETVEDLFLAALRVSGREDLNFEPLPGLLRSYGARLLDLRGGAFCPGGIDRPVGSAVELVLRRQPQADVNGLVLDQPDGSVAVTLPQGLFAGGNTSVACANLRVNYFEVATWFPPRGHFYVVAPNDPRSRRSRRDGITRVAGEQVADVVLPADGNEGTPSASNPLRLLFTVPNAGNDGDVTEYTCAWWDGGLDDGSGAWTTQGCLTTDFRAVPGTSSVSVQCECSHATPFAVLASRPTQDRLPHVFLAAMAVVLGGCALVALLSLYLAGGGWRNDDDGDSTLAPLLPTAYQRVLASQWLAAALAALLLLLSAALANDMSKGSCAAVGLLSHVALLAALLMPVQAALVLRGMVLKGQSYPSRSAERTAVRQRILTVWLLAVGAAGLYAAVHGGVYGSFVDATYGAVSSSRELCFIPRHSWGSWLVMVVLPAVVGMVAIVYVYVATQASVLEWRRHDDLIPERLNIREVKVLATWQTLFLLMWCLAALAALINSVATSAVFLVAAIVAVGAVIIAYIARQAQGGGHIRPKRESHALETLASVQGGSRNGSQGPSKAWGADTRGVPRYVSPYMATAAAEEVDDAYAAPKGTTTATAAWGSPGYGGGGRGGAGRTRGAAAANGGNLSLTPQRPASSAAEAYGDLPDYDGSYLQVPAPLFSEPMTPAAAVPAWPQDHESERKVPLGGPSAAAMADDDFDDLLYALQTGSLANNTGVHDAFAEGPAMEGSDDGRRYSAATDGLYGDDSGGDEGGFALRRYDISDTHL